MMLFARQSPERCVGDEMKAYRCAGVGHGGQGERAETRHGVSEGGNQETKTSPSCWRPFLAPEFRAGCAKLGRKIRLAHVTIYGDTSIGDHGLLCVLVSKCANNAHINIYTYDCNVTRLS